MRVAKRDSFSVDLLEVASRFGFVDAEKRYLENATQGPERRVHGLLLGRNLLLQED
jgi:hypothetical protein